MSDHTEKLIDKIKTAYHDKQALCIQGSNTKSFLTLDTHGDILSTLDHTGIVDYEPTELVLTARTGTRIEDINTLLNEQNQALAFEPPQFNGKATLGGIVACGLSGPARPWVGAVRDFVLGTQVINGQGELLNFGGRVMKNVAGYDVSRLMVGAYGVLGVLLEVSLKVLPKAESELTVVFEIEADAAIKQMNNWSGTSLPLSGACWTDGKLFIRLSGSIAGISAAHQNIGGEVITDDSFWPSIRDFSHPFFTTQQPLWRLGFAPATPMLPISGQWLLDWGGAQRWLVSEEADEQVIQNTIEHNGHYSQRHGKDQSKLRMPLEPSIMQIHQRLKTSFDPANILNPGRYYPEL